LEGAKLLIFIEKRKVGSKEEFRVGLWNGKSHNNLIKKENFFRRNEKKPKY